ncbi:MULTISPECIES: tetratricopeptide repeat protein [unclassified Methanoregula]|uniref:tetratricopeptide repeat protein n=1 Tax=unclassified Methanoregula TaxID=2649730 RepID=UPI0009D44265|nr:MULTISPECIES: tetratricopeptide repeat protein [unclassified Methanoregula]OPX63627.1 MAG: Tetratricopeptide repeat protein [Methanoregula sp. PtaB.Bin085]OPY36207.1 MAG: Tetratricopeptide repeat protein [Methanoregula sp. PtaU1.Bin006]
MNWVYMKGIPIDAQFLYRKALELVQQERYEIALRYFRQATVIAPTYAKAYLAMAACHYYLARYDDAIRLFTCAIEIDPACEEARIQRDMVMNLRELQGRIPQQSTGMPF